MQQKIVYTKTIMIKKNRHLMKYSPLKYDYLKNNEQRNI